MLDHFSEAKNLGDALSFGLAVATLSQILPQIAALLSITWTLIRIGDWAVGKIKRQKSKTP
jgi:hypothetical protein